jgi:hypothetical protein
VTINTEDAAYGTEVIRALTRGGDVFKRLFVVVVAILPVLALAGYATASDERSAAAKVASATAAFHDVDKALAAGYAPSDFPAVPGVGECLSHATDGAMGIHYVNGTLLTDGVINAATPEALVYEPTANGKLKLVALEYVIFQSQSPGGPPSLFGVPFLPNDGTTLGIPPFYAMHSWIWKPNPSGLFFPWNPNVSCDN